MQGLQLKRNIKKPAKEAVVIVMKEIMIDGVAYVPKGSENQLRESNDGLPFVLVRGYSSGVNFGYLAEENGSCVKLLDSRRIWSWTNATECNQIAVEGVGKDSKVTVVVQEKTITDAIEVINITEKAAENLINQPIWKK